MRVVFMGTPDFAVPSLRVLASSHEIVAVYTRPDSVSGRGGARRPSPVKALAEQLGLVVRQPVTLRDESEQEWLRALAPDAIVVAAYGLILPKPVLDVPRFGCVNVHGSLLPRWRGAAPVQRAVLEGDEVTGVAIMRMEEGLDTGPYCLTGEVCVDDKTADELTDELSELGAALLAKALTSIEEGTCRWTEQDESAATYAEKISKDDVAIDACMTVTEALRRVRASSRQAPARVVVAGRGATVIAAHHSHAKVPAGAVACDKRSLLLGFSDGTLSLVRVKPDGKGEMPGCDWARGARFEPTERWECAR